MTDYPTITRALDEFRRTNTEEAQILLRFMVEFLGNNEIACADDVASLVEIAEGWGADKEFWTYMERYYDKRDTKD